ncbi:MAG: hypothetical protein AAF405_07455, partial [Pseudomonadota bacterium]
MSKTPLPSEASSIEALERDVELNPRAYKEQISKLETVLEDAELRPQDQARALRLLGVSLNRAQLYRDALECLARAEAIAGQHNDIGELGKIRRERAVVHAWRGDDRQASIELAHALAYAGLNDDARSTALGLCELGRIEWEARRYGSAVRILKSVCDRAGSNLPPRDLQRARLTLCQALNGNHQYQEAVTTAEALKNSLDQTDRLYFLACLEETAAFIGLGQHDAARQSLAVAKSLLPPGEHAFEYTEYDEAEAALAAAQDGPSIAESLQKIARKHDNQNLAVRSAETRMRLGRHFYRQGDSGPAREAFCTALRTAVAQDNADLAE